MIKNTEIVVIRHELRNLQRIMNVDTLSLDG